MQIGLCNCSRETFLNEKVPFPPPTCLLLSPEVFLVCHRHTSFFQCASLQFSSQVPPPPPPPPITTTTPTTTTIFLSSEPSSVVCLSVIDPHMYFRYCASPLGTDFTDEPIHIINVSLQYEELEGKSDAELIMKCYKFVQVNEPGSLHEAADGLVSLGGQICTL